MTAPSNVFVLDDAVTILGARELRPDVRSALGIEPDECAVEGPDERSYARVVSGATAELLRRFRSPTPLDEAILDVSRSLGIDPFDALDASIELLDGLLAAGILRCGDAAAPAPSRLRAGDLLMGHRLDRAIRDLPDTQVFAATDPSGRPVAIKVAPNVGGPAPLAAIRREAALQRAAAGPGVPEVLGQGVVAGMDYLVSEWCPGVPVSIVAAELRSAGDRVGLLRLCRRVVRSFARLHAVGVIHGDVRGSNVLVDRDGETVVVDFGLSFHIGRLPLRRSTEFGTLEPEAARRMLDGKPAPSPTVASEVYAVGALVWALLSGADLHEWLPDASAMRERVAAGTEPSFASVGEAPWPAVELIVERATAADPHRRYRTLDRFAAALGAVEVPAPRRARPHRSASAGLVDRTIDALVSGRPATTPGNVHDGRAGEAWFLYRAALIRGEPELLLAADVVLGRAAEATPGSALHGRTGTHAVAALIAAALGDRVGARAHAFELVGSSCAVDVELFDGRAGDLCAMALVRHAVGAHVAPPALDVAIDGRRRALLGLWTGGIDDRAGGVPHLGMAHGWAGIAHALLTAPGGGCRDDIAEIIGDIAARRVEIGRGVAWVGTVRPDHVPRTPDFAPGWCAGSAGMIHLLADAHDRRVADVDGLVEAAAWHCADHPDRNPQLCCGLAGRAIALCRAWRHTGDGSWLERADSLVHAAAREAAGAPVTGLFRGRLGVALAALEFERPETAMMPLLGRQQRPESHGSGADATSGAHREGPTTTDTRR